MRFDWVITAGNLLQLLTGLLVLVGVYVRIAERLARIETKLDVLWERRRQERD